jgi:hypothetical protein
LAKQRRAIPRLIRESVLAEFRHRCAVCAADRPHLHHIDENPNNNDPQNLLPLCPNCHLTDQHDPTAPVDSLKLKLFRRYKDPAILSPQFHPLFKRLEYLLRLQENSEVGSADRAGGELVAFVNSLEMGKFYHARVHDLISDSTFHIWSVAEPDTVSQQKRREEEGRYRRKLLANRDEAVALVVEMLR